MSHYYDKEYDLEEEKQKATRSMDAFIIVISNLNLFIEQVNAHHIEIPDILKREIRNRLDNFRLYIEKDKGIISKADKLISEGNRFLGIEEFHNNFRD